MATNRFERPIANRYNFQYYTPNFEAWSGLLGQVQQEYNQFEALAAKVPNYITGSESDRAGFEEYQGNIQGIRDNLVGAFQEGGRQGRAAMNAAQFDIMEMWQPGGLATQLESRLASFTAESERISDFYEEFGEVTPYTHARQMAELNPLRNQAGQFQGVGSLALVNPYSTEDVTKWIKDHEGMIAETLLNNNMTRRYMVGNEFESVYEVIAGAKGKQREHIFKVLADSMPDDMKNWFQYKHNARSYNSGGLYDPGDQTTMYQMIDGENGQQMMAINPESELAQHLWAVSGGAAYIDPIRSTHKLTDWRAKKIMELNEENYVGFFTGQGPATQSKGGGIFAGAQSVSQIHETMRAAQSNYEASVDRFISGTAFTGDRAIEARQEVMDMVQAMNAGEMTDQEFRASLQGMGQVDGRDIDNIITARNVYLQNKSTADYIIQQAEANTGISATDLENERERLGGFRLVNTSGGGKSGEEIVEGLANGKYEISADIGGDPELQDQLAAGVPLDPGTEVTYKLTDTRTGETFTIYDRGEWAYNVQNSEEFSKYQRRYKTFNSNVALGDQFTQDFIETPEVVSNFIYRDPRTGQVNNIKSQQLTQQARDWFIKNGNINNYSVRSNANFDHVYNFDLKNELDGFPLDANGNPDFENASVDINFNAQPTAGRGHSVTIRYRMDHDGDPETAGKLVTATVPMPAQLQENLMTGGRGFANLTPDERHTVVSDYQFNTQLNQARQTVHGMNIPENRPLSRPVIINNEVVGNFIVTNNVGTYSATQTDQGAGRAPKILFQWMDDNGNYRTADPSSQEARNAFNDLTR